MNIEEAPVSKNNIAFLKAALREGVRVDGRRDVDARRMRFSFIENGSCEVLLGKTRVLCVVTGVVVDPYPDRPNDGMYTFDVVLSPMASAAFVKEVSSCGTKMIKSS